MDPTREFCISEFLRCKDSFKYYCKTYVKIEMPGGDIPLDLYDKQDELVSLLYSEHYVLVLKTRQIGISTIIEAYISWLHTFYDNVVVGILSKDGSEATSFARHIMSILDKLPKWMAPKYKKQTEQTYILENGGECYASTINPKMPEKTLRGKALTFLVVDEAAFIAYVDEAWTGMMPALATNQLHAKKNNIPFGTIVVSTPNKTVGVGKWFYSRYVSALSGSDIFKPFVIHWKQIPQLAGDPSWYNTQCRLAGNDPRKISQELDLKFLPTSGSFLEEKTIETLQNIDIKPIDVLKIFGGEIWTFQKPVKDKFYITGVDTAPEFGLDKSAITVWDYETLDEVWEYQVKCSVTDFTKMVKFACSNYPGMVVVESNSYGNQVLEALDRSEFSTMVYKERRTENRVYPGLSTNTKTRPLMVASLYSYITEHPEIVKSKRLALELVGLINKNGRVEADRGCTDDLCLAAAVAFYVRQYDPPLMLAGKASEVTDQFFDVMDMNLRAGIRGSQLSANNLDEKDIDEDLKDLLEELDNKQRENRIDIGSGAFVDTFPMYDKA